MTITLHDGRSFLVRFRQQDPPVLVAEPVKPIAEQASDDEYMLGIKLVITPSRIVATESSTSSTTTTVT